jgi:trans-2,3-dihydro-3-hydroxyanthranilate isomerase
MRYKVFDVFAQKPFEGNPTGVVYSDKPLDTDLMQKLARELAFPDTIFLLPKSRPDLLFTSRTFTPNQELEICGQGMIGAMYALLDDSAVAPGRHTVEIAIGERSVLVERGDPVSVFCSLGRPTIFEPSVEERNRIDTLLDSVRIKPERATYVALGRKRLIVQVQLSELGQAALEPAAVVETCRALGVTGIVLCADGGEPETVRSRHFTLSHKGGEDAVTGGASGAILAFYRSAGKKVDQLQVYQGDFATRGGWMQVRVGAPDGEMWIGGKAVKIIEGEIQL